MKPTPRARVPWFHEIDEICAKHGKWLHEWSDLPSWEQELLLQKYRAEQASHKEAPQSDSRGKR